MPVVFIDSDGHRGRITDGLSVTYTGRVHVEEYVRSIEAEAASTEHVLDELILGLVQDLDIEEVRRETSSRRTLRP